MTPRQPASLQGRLTALVLGLVVAVWLVTGFATWFDARHELDELLDSHLAQAAALLVVQQLHEASEHDGDDNEDNQSLDTPQLHRYSSKVAFQVFHEGQPTLRSANAPARPLVADAQGRLDTQPDGFRTVQVEGTTWRVFATRGAERDIRVFVGEQLDSRSAILRAVLRSTLWPMLLALPLLALGAWWAVKRGVQPLRELGHTLAGRDPQALSPVTLQTPAPAEMQPMLQALNRLFERSAALMASERRFTADAAHELRTPIAAIRAQAQVALGESDDTARRHALAYTLQGCDRATRLVEQLLTLSRLEAGSLPAQTDVDLHALLRQVVGDLAPGALARGQQIELRTDGDVAGGGEVTASAPAPAPFTVRGDATLLAVLLRNLVDNAIRYSPPGASVVAELSRSPDLDLNRDPNRDDSPAPNVRLRVQDSGPGMAPDELKRLGERFFRVLGAGDGASGSGLGFSIVRRIAAAHGAQVEVGRSATLGGLQVQVDWPAAG